MQKKKEQPFGAKGPKPGERNHHWVKQYHFPQKRELPPIWQRSTERSYQPQMGNSPKTPHASRNSLFSSSCYCFRYCCCSQMMPSPQRRRRRPTVWLISTAVVMICSTVLNRMKLRRCCLCWLLLQLRGCLNKRYYYNNNNNNVHRRGVDRP